LEGALETLLDELRGKSAAVLRVTIKGLREISMGSFNDALKRSEEIYLNELLKTDDVEEGLQAFLEKRKPQWKNS
jgi:enoyl-CoA hydratase/carnithine racemase